MAVIGAVGRMGSTVCRAVAQAADLELVGAVDPGHGGEGLAESTGAATDIRIDDELGAVLDRADVVVDFTVAESARSTLAQVAAAGVHAVVGTTGLGADDLAALEAAFDRSNCIVAPNFAIGAVLMMRFAELAAPWFDSAEIIELHHDSKRDAPSGTAMATAARLAGASSDWSPDPTLTTLAEGARGGLGAGGVRVHSVRLAGLVAHQEVLLGTTGQTLTIRHDSYDRTSFMPGVLLAVRRVASCPGVTVGLDELLWPDE